MSGFLKLKIAGANTAQMMKIAHPVSGLHMEDKAGNVAFLMLTSVDGDLAQTFDRELLDRRVSSKRRPTGEDMMLENVYKMAKLAAAGKDWLLVDFEGNALELDCTEQNARALFTDAPWLLDQAIEFTRDRGNFMKS